MIGSRSRSDLVVEGWGEGDAARRRTGDILRLASLLVLGFAVGAAARAAEPGVVLVAPAELTRRADLIGRLVAVDDRVTRFQWHNDPSTSIPERPYDEIYLKRTPVIFRLPPRLRFETAPRATAIRIEGILKHEGGQWFCDVTAFELFPSDLERLQRATAALDPHDVERRLGWARWAERRAREFGKPDDPAEGALLERARRLEAEALQIEAERPVTDAPRHWLELARRARQHEVPEPEPGALAHRAFSARLAAADSAVDLQALVNDIAEFWPASPAPIVAAVDLETWLTPYANDPATTYRIAPEPVRAALGHRLWSDATQRLVERRMAAEPGRALELAQEAATALRDRPLVVKQLLQRGLVESSRNLESLRQGDVVERARVYRETLKQPEAARDLLRRWLDAQRNHRLSATDAEGRLILGQQYDSLLDDRETAVTLLREAWQIDPQSKEIADTFRRWNFRKVNDQWIEPPRAVADASGEPGSVLTPATAPSTTELLGLTPVEVRARLGGKPDRVIYAATQGQLVEQWIYRLVDQDRYVNFLHTPGDPLPKVVAYRARPRPRSEIARPR